MRKIDAHRSLERTFVGTALTHPDKLRAHYDLPVDSFFYWPHQCVWRAVCAIGSAADEMAVADWLLSRNELDRVGGYKFLASLALASQPYANFVELRRRLLLWRQRRLFRRFLAECGERLDKRDPESTEDDIAEWAASSLRSLSSVAETGAIAKRWAQRTAEHYDANAAHSVVSLGLPEIDAHMALWPGDLVVLAARPSMGKTAFAMHIADACAQQNCPIIFFSLEQSGEQLFARRAAARAGVTTEWSRAVDVDAEDRRAVIQALADLAALPIWLDDSPRLTINEIEAKARRAMDELGVSGPGVIIIDYLQLVHGTRKGNATREQEVSFLSRTAKAIARDLKWTVLALCQLNRAVESRTDKRPLLSDLRESGAIEQDADLVAMLYRDGVYDPYSPNKEVAELLIRKNRHGATGTARMRFDAEFTRFSSLDWTDSYPIQANENRKDKE